VTKALVFETEAKTETAGFETEAEAVKILPRGEAVPGGTGLILLLGHTSPFTSNMISVIILPHY